MRLDLVGGELDQVESMWERTQWGRTRHGAKPAATDQIHARYLPARHLSPKGAYL